MNLNSLRPAGDFSALYGAKTVVYGPPGVGKTPVGNTAPRPVMLCVEPGMLSMRGSKIPSYGGFTVKTIDEFFEWAMKSNEMKNFDTIIIDSISQMAEIKLADAQAHNRDGRKAYGEMSEWVMKHLDAIFFLQYKHTYLIAKQMFEDNLVRPYFPGKDLNTKVPHRYDVIMQLAVHNIPGAGQHKAFRTSASMEAVARDRSGKLAEYEPPDLTALFNKIMS